jgi:hypothetical protein
MGECRLVLRISLSSRRLLEMDRDQPQPFPALQETFFFLLNRDEALEVLRDVVKTPLTIFRDRLERLRVAAWQEFDYFWGMAVTVR